MKEIVFATNNRHKLEEVREILSKSYKVLSLKDIGCFDEIPETAETLEGNALIKAKWVFDKYGFDCFSDDTGLEVDYLNGAPGVYSARYAGENATFKDNYLKLLDALSSAGDSERIARFRTVICLIKSGESFYFDGIVEGKIATYISGDQGFGYDPVFIPNGYQETFAEMGMELKNRISHRALATEKLVDFLLTSN